MDYKFRNNAREEFNFFLNEENKPCLNINFGDELVAAFILSKEELNTLTKNLEDMNNDVADE